MSTDKTVFQSKNEQILFFFLATIFLNKTNGKVALPLFWDFLSKWSNPKAVGDAQEEDIATFLQPIGLYNR